MQIVREYDEDLPHIQCDFDENDAQFDDNPYKCMPIAGRGRLSTLCAAAKTNPSSGVEASDGQRWMDGLR